MKDYKNDNLKSNGKTDRLPDAELSIMKVIWKEKAPVGTGRIIELISEEKNWSRSTIQVLLSRLEERGFLECQKEGRLKYYLPLVKEETYCKKETKNFLENFYNNSYKNLIASLVQDKAMSEKDVEEIIEIIKKGGTNG